MPIATEKPRLEQIPTTESAGGGAMKPPFITAVGQGDEWQFNPQRKSPLDGGLSGSLREKTHMTQPPRMSVMDYLVATPPVQRVLLPLATTYGLSEIVRNLIKVTPVG